MVKSVWLYPYRAWWQPMDEDAGKYPVYAPKEMQFEFGSFESLVELPFGEGPSSKHGTGGGGDPRGDRIHLTTARCAVQHSAEGTSISFDKPVLVVGGHMRVRMFGKQQRQTINIEANEYYTCIQHCHIDGVAVRGLACGYADEEGGGAWRLVEGASCHLCGSHALGKGHMASKALSTCLKCRRAHYCSNKHRTSDGWHVAHECPEIVATLPPGAA